MSKFLKSSDDMTIHYSYSPANSKKPVLVLLHGLGSNLSEWKNTVATAKKNGYPTLSIDLRGHGLSSTPDDFSYYNFDNFSEDIRLILHLLKIKQFVLIGHSFGGSIAIAYCTKYLDSSLKSLILIESTHKYPYKKYHELNANPIFCFILRKLIAWNIITNKNFPKIPELDLILLRKENAIFQIYDELYHTSFKAIIQCLDAAKVFSSTKQKKIRYTLQSIKSPSLLITATKDRIIDPKYSYELQKLIPSSKIRVFENAGHQLPLENYKLLNKEIFSFLAKLN